MDFRLVNRNDRLPLLEYYSQNADHFKPWEPLRDPEMDTPSFWSNRVETILEAQKRKEAAYFVAWDPPSREITAHCTLSQIYYGAFHACYMGFGVSKKHEGTGLMKSVCEHVIAYAFDDLHLHRIMANYIPLNVRSARLLKSLGFVEEGLAKEYLKIDGEWQDHILTALINESC